MSGRVAKKVASKVKSKAKTPIIENAPKYLVLGLYKQLIRESRKLKLTDPVFFRNRMRQEFFKRKDAKDNNLYYIVCKKNKEDIMERGRKGEKGYN